MNKAVLHRNMRLLLILIFTILSFILCFGNLDTNIAFAQNPDIPQITVESKTVHRGQTFTLDVDLSNNIGLMTLYLTLDYDSSAMTLTDIIQGDTLGQHTLSTTNVETDQGYAIKPFNIFWDNTQRDYSSGTIITFIFDSNIEASVGQYPVTLTCDYDNTLIESGVHTDVEISNGVVNLTTGEYQAIYRNYDNGETLFEKDYNADDIPSYPSSLPTPTRDDAEYYYEFIGWKGVPSGTSNVLIFEPNFSRTPKEYAIFMYVDGANEYPDNIIDEAEDYFGVVECRFGDQLTDYLIYPQKQYYEFFGWYEDDGFQVPLSFGTMPARDVKLYGQFVFEVRERIVPRISLEAEYTDNDQQHLTVTASILEGNPGLNTMVLTLKYDSVLTLVGFRNLDLLDMTFGHTDISELSSDNFKFSYDSTVNQSTHGDFLELYFVVDEDAPHDVYNVTFDYDFHKDATYVNSNNEVKYTKLEILSADVPVGLINHWNESVGLFREVDITSQDGKPTNVYLTVELVTEEVDMTEDDICQNVGSNMYISSAYSIKLMQNRREIQPNSTLVIRIKLTEVEKRSKLQFYHLGDDGKLTSQEFTIENGYLVFKIDHLSNWVIFSSYSSQTAKVLFLVGMPIILAIATMLYAFRLKQKRNQNKKEAQND